VFNWSDLDDAEVNDHTVSLAKAVIATEINGLNLLSESLGESFCDAINLLMATTGRVIFLGMGKSGHVARKIAATMASTGTPAFFVHLSEAAHGDMGMIQSNDVVVLISNSGEASEAIQVIRYCKRANVKIIVISAGNKSLMMRAADVGLLLPNADEACPVGLAPTTSSTMTMSLGDALAVVLMQKRGFTLPNFLELHPGGKIGLMRTPVTDFMAKAEALPLVRFEDKMDDVIIEIAAKSYGIAGVLDDDGNLIGTISDGDLRRNIHGLMNAKAGDVMHAIPVTVGTNAQLKDVKSLMSEKKISCVFVCDQQKPVGLIHMHHLLALKVVI
jgi:arabinose-5-phosphate isomerase